jgi:hypothetical protein
MLRRGTKAPHGMAVAPCRSGPWLGMEVSRGMAVVTRRIGASEQPHNGQAWSGETSVEWGDLIIFGSGQRDARA